MRLSNDDLDALIRMHQSCKPECDLMKALRELQDFRAAMQRLACSDPFKALEVFEALRGEGWLGNRQ